MTNSSLVPLSGTIALALHTSLLYSEQTKYLQFPKYLFQTSFLILFYYFFINTLLPHFWLTFNTIYVINKTIHHYSCIKFSFYAFW